VILPTHWSRSQKKNIGSSLQRSRRGRRCGFARSVSSSIPRQSSSTPTNPTIFSCWSQRRLKLCGLLQASNTCGLTSGEAAPQLGPGRTDHEPDPVGQQGCSSPPSVERPHPVLPYPSKLVATAARRSRPAGDHRASLPEWGINPERCAAGCRGRRTLPIEPIGIALVASAATCPFSSSSAQPPASSGTRPFAMGDRLKWIVLPGG